MDNTHIKRLQWMANAKKGELFPDDLFIDTNNWGPALTETAKWALQVRNNTLMECHDIALSVDSGRGNEKIIAETIKGLIVKIP